MHHAFLYSAQLGIMKRLSPILVLLLVVSATARAKDADTIIPFSVGEKLTYQIFWGPFVVGRATLEVAGIEPTDGHNCYHLVARAKTSGLINLLFPVDSLAESWLDCDGLFARRYTEDRTEGTHHRTGEAHYDYARKETVITNRLNGRAKHYPLNQPVQDVISSIYVVRTRKLMLDSEQTFTINAASTNYTVTVRPDQRKAIWVHPLGDTQALRIEPMPTLTIISANKGRMWFWMSDDARHLPLLVNSEIKLGNAKLVLFSIGTGNTPSKTTGTPARAANSSTLTPTNKPLASQR
jgi:hypothetical protein